MKIKTLIQLLTPYADSEALVEIEYYDSGTGEFENRLLSAFSAKLGQDGVVVSVTLEPQ